MIKSFQGKYAGKELYLCTVQTPAESRQQGLPAGVVSFWEYDTVRILEPTRILQIVTESARRGDLPVNAMLQRKYAEAHYQGVARAQQKMIIEHFQAMIEKVRHSDTPEEYKHQIIANYESEIRLHSAFEMHSGLDSQGVFLPDEKAKQALEKHLNGELQSL